DDRLDHRRPQPLPPSPGGERCLHPRSAVVSGRQERLVLADEVVVERPGRHARLRGDVLDPDLLPALLHGQAQGGQAQRLAGGPLLALAQTRRITHGRKANRNLRTTASFPTSAIIASASDSWVEPTCRATPKCRPTISHTPTARHGRGQMAYGSVRPGLSSPRPPPFRPHHPLRPHLEAQLSRPACAARVRRDKWTGSGC